jgi:epoxyqueuosine reductase QueG
MPGLDSGAVKEMGIKAGATVVGIASAADFGLSREGFRPAEQLAGCRSVIVLASPSPKESLTSMTTAEYTANRNEMVKRMTEMAQNVAKQIKKSGHASKAVSSIGGKFVEGEHLGFISLKHAAELAGIGRIGRNWLLTNPEYGNLLWLSAVLTDADLVPDGKMQYDFCADCNKCVEECPKGALDDPVVLNKKICANYCYRFENKKPEFKCYRCRQVCPYSLGK